VSTDVQREPGASLSNRSPRVVIRWTMSQLGMTGAQVSDQLDKGEPRIALGGGGGGRSDLPGDTGVSVTSAMMSPGDEKIVAQRLFDVLSQKRTLEPIAEPAAAAANVSGRWEVDIKYAASQATHTLHLVQTGNRLEGLHQGNFLTRDITGTINGDAVTLASVVTERHGDALTYRFSGKVGSGPTIAGTLDMGEYLSATWTARKRGPS
jgi:L-seryl-tRNA(Ser) seleniumtransferase